MKSTFRARWLASLEVISQVQKHITLGDMLLPSTIHLRSAKEKENGFCCSMFINKVTLWAAIYSACVVYTKTIIHLSVGESGGYSLHFGEICLNRSFSLSRNKKNKLKTIQWKKLRNWDVIEDKKIRHFSKF